MRVLSSLRTEEWMKSKIACLLFLILTAVASAAPMMFQAVLSGAAEAPPNASPGTGFTFVTIDPVAHTMRVEVTFGNLIGNTTASHIHAPTAVPLTGTAGVATQVPSFTGFPLGVTSGTMDNTFDMSMADSYNPSFLNNQGGTPASAEAALFSAIQQGRAYLNIHSTEFPGGEIRGFLVATAVPEPATWGLMAVSIAGFTLLRRRRRSAS
jgi:hypothetical protein